MQLPPMPPEHQTRIIELEGSRASFVGDDDKKTMFLFLKDGTVYPVDFVAEGKSMSKLNMGHAIARTTIPAVVRRITESHLFIGSAVGPSVLLKTAHVEEEVDDDEMGVSPSAVVQMGHNMDLDLDDDEGKQHAFL